MRAEDDCDYREGVVLNMPVKDGKGSFVNCGIAKVCHHEAYFYEILENVLIFSSFELQAWHVSLWDTHETVSVCSCPPFSKGFSVEM